MERPWLKEPDRVLFKYEGFPCLLNRAPTGAWCGYVGVPPGHPAHGKDYGDVEVHVHGGLTYSDSCQEDGPICHVPEPGEPDDVWWLGFDCAHYNDFAPKHDDPESEMNRHMASLYPDWLED